MAVEQAAKEGRWSPGHQDLSLARANFPRAGGFRRPLSGCGYKKLARETGDAKRSKCDIIETSEFRMNSVYRLCFGSFGAKSVKQSHDLVLFSGATSCPRQGHRDSLASVSYRRQLWRLHHLRSRPRLQLQRGHRPDRPLPLWPRR